MACMKLYVAMGAKPENFIVFDKDGVLHKGRTDLEDDRGLFAIDKADVTLEKAMTDADVFVGLSVGNTVTPEMVKSMAKKTHCIRYGESGSGNYIRCGDRRSG